MFILADDLGYGDLGCYGQHQIKTPNIDRLAAEGVRFTSCYSGSTVCAPSRCALMTGKHTGHCRIRSNDRVPLLPEDVTLAEVLHDAGYLADGATTTTTYLAGALEKPLLVEGPAGVGKTELAKAVARATGADLVRLQCYEGLDEARTLYEWKYGKQLLYTQILKDRMGVALADAKDMDEAMGRLHGIGDLFYSNDFLEPRPLMKALQEDDGCVLLIDEIDKSDEAFEAFLLEVLSAYQVSIPELGVLKAKTPPLVFLTSNNVRDLGDALKRRCLHLHIPLPDAALEQRIVASRVPGIEAKLTQELVGFVQSLRTTGEIRKIRDVSRH